MGRIRRGTAAAVLAALVVFGTAGMASAGFSARSSGTLSATAFKLNPPTGLRGTCASRMPVVTFVSSISIGVVPEHAGATPPQVFGYTTSLKVNGTLDPNGNTTLDGLVTRWAGRQQNKKDRLVFTIVTTYGSWKSAAATVTFSC
jgi:hypothetical protein